MSKWIAISGLMISFLVSALMQAAAEPGDRQVAKRQNWSGLVSEKAGAKLPGGIKKKLGERPFTSGVIRDSKSFATFAAEAEKAPRDRSPVWQEWKKGIDWDSEVVVYVVLNLSTNSLRMGSWEAAKEGVGTLTVKWSGIEPFYGPNNPAVFARVPRKGLDRIKVVVAEQGTLVEIPMKEKGDRKRDE